MLPLADSLRRVRMSDIVKWLSLSLVLHGFQLLRKAFVGMLYQPDLTQILDRLRRTVGQVLVFPLGERLHFGDAEIGPFTVRRINEPLRPRGNNGMGARDLVALHRLRNRRPL